MIRQLVKIPFVDLYLQYLSLKAEIDAAIAEGISDSDFIRGKHMEPFEKEFAEYIGCKHAVALANGTVALELALEALGVGQGDCVVVTPRSFIASVSCVVTRGAIPVFADVDPQNYNITADSIASQINLAKAHYKASNIQEFLTITQSLINIANKYGKKVLIDPKGSDYSKYKGAYLLTPNIKEASEATKINIIDDTSLNQAIIQLKSQFDLDISLITLSDKGVAVYDDEFRIQPTFAREVFDVTGAGDTVLASLGFALACDLNIDEAIEFSNFAAGIVVGKIGSATATLNEIIEYESSLNKSFSEEHIKTLNEIIVLCTELKSRGKRVVFTNGCFDLLHAGHVKYLETAKSFGDVLIIGLNSDRSVTALKGEGRPINVQMDRAYILAALEVVDYVVIFDEDTPYKLIKAIKPHTLVKGGDYEDKEVIGQDIADELKLVEFLDGKSSTQTIEKIKQYN